MDLEPMKGYGCRATLTSALALGQSYTVETVMPVCVVL